MAVASEESSHSLTPDIPDPVALLNAWLAVEALQPQTFKTQKDLLGGEPPAARRKGAGKGKDGRDAPLPRALCPFDLAGGRMPWETPEGDRDQLAIAEDERLVWYVPLGFVKMEPAVARLVTEVEPEGPDRERGAGVAVLALAAFDEAGRALPSSLLLSSFGWACGKVLAGEIDQLHRFVDLEADLRHQLGQALVELDLDGRRIATSPRRFAGGMRKLMTLLSLPEDLLERPEVALRVIGEADNDPVEIINSFYLRDLHRVRKALETGAGGATLAAYLGQAEPAGRLDVLADKALEHREFNRKVFNELQLQQLDLAPYLQKIKAPTLLLWGDKDRVIDISSIEVFKHNLTAAKTTVSVLPQIGHLPMLEQPGETAKRYSAFLGS